MKNELLDFKFPVFKLREHLDYKELDGVMYIKNTENEWKVLDNKNLAGNTLAARRISIDTNKRYPLDRAIFTYAQLLRHHTPKDRYIDANGKCFKYKKTKIVPLKYREIIDVNYLDGYGMALTVKGMDNPIPVPAGSPIEGYVGLLEFADGYILYELSDEKKDATWRKI